MYKLILTDVDGTLISDDQKITPLTKQALQKADAMGVKVVICTGRFPAGIAHFRQELGFEPIYSCLNSALIKDGSQYLNLRLFPKDLYCEVMSIIYDVMDTIIVFAEDSYAIKASDESWALQNSIYRGKEGIRVDLRDIELVKRSLRSPILKILVKDNNIEKVDRYFRMINEKLSDLGTFVKSMPNNIEINSKGLDKGLSVDILCRHFGLSKDQVIAFGDFDNDIEMIKSAGLGIAMGNASKKLLEVADYVTDTNNNDGIAKALDRFLFV